MAAKKKQFFKIGEACKQLDIQPYVLRYWETEFGALKPDKSKSGQRVYSEDDLEVIRRIKELLYDEGYTIAGAKKKLEAELAAGPPKTGSSQKAEEPAPAESPPAKAPKSPKTEAEQPAAADEAAAAGDAAEDAEPTPDDAPAAEPADLEAVRAGLDKALEQSRDLLDRLESSG